MTRLSTDISIKVYADILGSLLIYLLKKYDVIMTKVDASLGLGQWLVLDGPYHSLGTLWRLGPIRSARRAKLPLVKTEEKKGDES